MERSDKLSFEEAVAGILPGRYRHFKGKEYEVIAIARHSETEEPMVVYRQLYGEHGLWVRPRWAAHASDRTQYAWTELHSQRGPGP